MPYQENKLFTPPIPELVQGITRSDNLPEGVCYTTASILEIRFMDESFPDVVRRYLGISTRRFLKSAQRGFYANPERGSTISDDALAHFLEDGEVKLDDLTDRDCYAYRYAAAVFQAMPLVYGDIDTLPVSFPDKSMFIEPDSPVATQGRLTELQREVDRIIDGVDGPEAFALQRPAVLRTFVFFGTSKWVQQNVVASMSDGITVPSVN